MIETANTNKQRVVSNDNVWVACAGQGNDDDRIKRLIKDES